MSKPNTIKIDEIEYIRADSIPVISAKKAFGDNPHPPTPYTVGLQWFIQTVTHYYIGTLIAVTQGELVLEDAAWIADTGRFNEFFKGKKASELEPCGPLAIINRGAIVAAMPKSLVIEVL